MKEKEGEGESRYIRRDDPDNRTCGDTKGVDEVDEESAESKKEVEEEEEEEEDNPKYFDTFPTLKELGYHEWLLKNLRLPWVNLRLNYYWIMSEGLKQCSKRHAFAAPRRLEDTTSVIDHYLGGMVLQKPFVKESGLIYGKDEGMVTFEKVKDASQNGKVQTY
ncbi:hypothetical protein Tco_1310601 [Tanacetum coccineum]